MWVWHLIVWRELLRYFGKFLINSVGPYLHGAPAGFYRYVALRIPNHG